MKFSIASAFTLLSTLAFAAPQPASSLSERAPPVSNVDCGWIALTQMGTGPNTTPAIKAALQHVNPSAWPDSMFAGPTTYGILTSALNNLVYGKGGSAQAASMSVSTVNLKDLSAHGLRQDDWAIVLVFPSSVGIGHAVNGRYTAASSMDLVDFQTHPEGEVYSVPAGSKITNVIWWKRT